MPSMTQELTSELAILEKILKPKRVKLSAPAAQELLDIRFDKNELDRMHALGAKAQEGTLSAKEQAELNGYELVGHFLAILHSRAREALQGSGRQRS